METLEWFQQLPVLLRALILGISAMAGGGFFLALLHKITPDAKDRMEDARLRRVEDDETIIRLEQRIVELERERDAAKEKAYTEREARIAEKQQAATTMIELELLRSKLGMANVILPEDVAHDRLDAPPDMPHDDRAGEHPG